MSVLDFLKEYASITNLISSFLGATIAVFLGGYLRERAGSSPYVMILNTSESSLLKIRRLLRA
jgi:hypothetical protein